MVIYKTTNLVNGKIYVGQDSKNNPNYYGSGKIIKRAIKKYGADSFKKEIIEECNGKEMLNDREKFWIKELDSRNNSIGYNITEGGEGALGLIHTEETKKYMRLINIGKNNPMYGVKLSEETIFKRSVKVKREGTHKGKNNGNFKFDIDGKLLGKLFITEDKTISEIATHFSCSIDVINNNLRKNKINKPRSNKYNLNIKDILSYVNDGLSQVEISKIYGCGNKYINKYIKKYEKVSSN